jgi:hypothetical protein
MVLMSTEGMVLSRIPSWAWIVIPRRRIEIKMIAFFISVFNI